MKNIAFVTNYMNDEMLESAVSFLPAGAKLYSVPGVNGYYGQAFFSDMIKEIKEDYVIYLDTDCFIFNMPALMLMLREFIRSGASIQGMQDGGVVSHRCHSPIYINPFLSFWNLKAIRGMSLSIKPKVILETKEFYNILRKDYFNTLGLFADYKRLNIVRSDGLTPFSYSNDYFEPYYKLQAQIREAGGVISFFGAKDAPEVDGDGASTIVSSNSGSPVAIHTWFSRDFGRDEYHTDRIKRVRAWASSHRIFFSNEQLELCLE